MDFVLQTPLDHKELSISGLQDFASPMLSWTFPSTDIFCDDGLLSGPTRTPNLFGAVSNANLPSFNSSHSLSPDSMPTTSSSSISHQSWISAEKDTTEHNAMTIPTTNAPSVPHPVTNTRPRGRPRKDLSKKETTPQPSNTMDKYRAKNRRASARCREKERHQAAELEKSFKEQTQRNLALKQTMTTLREELFCLQMQALQHDHCFCKDVQGYNQRRAQEIAVAWDLPGLD